MKPNKKEDINGLKIAYVMDCIEAWITEMRPELRMGAKKYWNDALKSVTLARKQTDKHLNESFAESVDHVRGVIDNIFDKNYDVETCILPTEVLREILESASDEIKEKYKSVIEQL